MYYYNPDPNPNPYFTATPHCNIRRDFSDTKHDIVLILDIGILYVARYCPSYTVQAKPRPKCCYFVLFLQNVLIILTLTFFIVLTPIAHIVLY
jgi:hypothetical protein